MQTVVMGSIGGLMSFGDMRSLLILLLMLYLAAVFGTYSARDICIGFKESSWSLA